MSKNTLKRDFFDNVLSRTLFWRRENFRDFFFFFVREKKDDQRK